MRRKDRNDRKDLIDGQQRLTTIIMLLKALVNELGTGLISDYVNDTLWSKIRNCEFVLSSPDGLNENIVFLEKLLLDQVRGPRNPAQLNIERQYTNIKNKVSSSNLTEEYIINLISNILASVTTVHEVEDVIEANRIFLTLNSRGKPLTYSEKIKALLIYHAARLPHGQMFSEKIHDDFGQVNLDYQEISGIIKNNKIKVRTEGGVDEDMLLGWHFCFFRQQNSLPTGKEAFLLISKELDSCADAVDKQALITSYTKSLVDFFSSFNAIISKSADNALFYEIIVICRLTAIIWPAVIALQHRNLLDTEIHVNDDSSLPLIRIMQLIDKVHRLSKVQGKEIIKLSHEIYNNDVEITPENILINLKGYHRSKWNRDMPTVMDAHNSDYITYLLFDATADGFFRSNIESLRSYNELNPTPAQILRIAPDMGGIKEYGITKRSNIGSVCNSLGNTIIIPKKINDVINEYVKQNGNPLPTEFKKMCLDHIEMHPLLPDVRSVFDRINEDTDMNKDFIDQRYEYIEQSRKKLDFSIHIFSTRRSIIKQNSYGVSASANHHFVIHQKSIHF